MAKSSLKVLQVLPALDSGGVERGTLEVAAELVKRGHESLVVSAGGRLISQLEREGSRHIEISLGKKSLFTLRHVVSLRKLILNEKVDIVHARSRLPAWIAFFSLKMLPKNCRPKFITTMHGLHSVSRYSKVMTYGEKIIAVSECVRRYILENYPDTDPEKIVVINRGIDPDVFRYGYRPSKQWLEQWYADYPQLVGKKVICLPGRITRLKGHAFFVRLIAGLLRDGFDVHGLIVGAEDPRRKGYAAEIHAMVDDLGLRNDLTFAGYRSDMREIYSACELVCSLSTKPEAFGRTVVEALSLGTPVVGFDHGGVGEILRNLFPIGRVVLGDEKRLLDCSKKIMNKTLRPSGNGIYLQSEMLASTLNVYAGEKEASM